MIHPVKIDAMRCNYRMWSKAGNQAKADEWSNKIHRATGKAMPPPEDQHAGPEQAHSRRVEIGIATRARCLALVTREMTTAEAAALFKLSSSATSKMLRHLAAIGKIRRLGPVHRATWGPV